MPLGSLPRCGDLGVGHPLVNTGVGPGLPGESTGRDEGGAHVVASRQGGETLHVHPQKAREGVRLGLTEGGELLGRVLHRAVALTELDAFAGEDAAVAQAVKRAIRRLIGSTVHRETRRKPVLQITVLDADSPVEL